MQTEENRNQSFFVYKASAGSGKTFHLAVSYIRICLQYFGQDRFIFRKILAITFTNKAVGEMKSRILFFLRCMALPKERLDAKECKQREVLLQHLSDLGPEEVLARRSGTVLKNILADYSGFSVMTIDSFYQALVHAFAFELRLPPNHRLELDGKLFTAQMVDVLFSRLGYDEALTGFVVEYLYHRLDSEKRWKPDRELAGIAEELFMEELWKYEPDIVSIPLSDYKALVDKLKREMVGMEREVVRMAENALSLLPDTVNPLTDFAQGGKGFGAWLLNIAKGDFGKAFAPNSHVSAAAENGRWVAKKTSAAVAAAIEGVAPQLATIYREIRLYAGMHYPDYVLYGQILKCIYPVALLGEFRKVADEIKASSRQVLIGETNRYIARIVCEEEVPFIYERLGERYSFFFIDEFQDTSRLQWRNLLPLVCEAFSKESVGGSGAQALLFGDSKQAIYRFRSGDVRQFVHLSRLDRDPAETADEAVLKAGFNAVRLDCNFRSREEIVRFNNAYFNQRRDTSADGSPIREVYDGLEQRLPDYAEGKSGGGVELLMPDQEEQYESFVFRSSVRIVEEALEDGYNYSDIAVLCRSNRLASEIAGYFSRQGIPVVSSESMLLSASPEVCFMMSAIRCVWHPEQVLARVHMLVYLYEKQNNTLPLEQVLPLAQTFSCFSGQLESWGYRPDWDLLRRMNLYDLFRHLADYFGIWRTDPYIMTLGDLVWAYHTDAEKSDWDFPDFWEERRDSFSLSNPDGVNAVQVMTIHKAKGLAFPIVIYPMKKEKSGVERPRRWLSLEPPVRAAGATLKVTLLNLNKEMLNTKYAGLYEEECGMSELDRLNLDYVAFTRAMDRLYLLAVPHGGNRNDIATFLQDKQGVSPSDIMGFGAYRYHYPAGCRFSPFSSGSREPVNVTSPFVFSNANVLPPLAYVQVEDASATGADAVRGTMVHRYLSRMFRRADVEWLRGVVCRDAELDNGMKGYMERLFSKIAEQPEADCLFGDSGTMVRTEAELFASDGSLYRVDRLLVKGKEVRLFDYKTGRPHDSHQSQLRGYVQCMEEIGYIVKDACLVYLDMETACMQFVRISVSPAEYKTTNDKTKE